MESFKTYHFWLYAILILISCTCTSSIFTLSDTACHDAAETIGADYGTQRAWGALGWGLCAPLAGFLNDYTDSYWSAIGLMTLLNVLMVLNLSKLDLVKPHLSQSILKDVRTVLSSADFVAFEAGVLLNGIGIGIVWYFLAWFITDIGGSLLLIGLAHAVQCFGGAMPFMFLSGWLIRRIGHQNAVTLSLMATSVRFLAYSSLSNPWLILPVECLDGITFGMFLASMTSYGKLKAKPGTEATTQALLSSSYEGLGAGLGCVIAGACFDHYGGYKTFFYAGLFFVGATAINITSTVLLFYRNRSKIRKEDFIISVVVSKETICESIRY